MNTVRAGAGSRRVAGVHNNLSITTFRNIPPDLAADDENVAGYLNDLNRALLDRVQTDGAVFISNAVIAGVYVLRACIVNFHTTLADIEDLPEIVILLGRTVHAEMSRQYLFSHQ